MVSYCLICLEFLFYKMKRVKEIKGIDETLSIYLIPLNGILKMVKTVGFNRMHFVTIKKKKPQKLIILQFWRSKVPKGPSGPYSFWKSWRKIHSLTFSSFWRLSEFPGLWNLPAMASPHPLLYQPSLAQLRLSLGFSRLPRLLSACSPPHPHSSHPGFSPELSPPSPYPHHFPSPEHLTPAPPLSSFSLQLSPTPPLPDTPQFNLFISL